MIKAACNYLLEKDFSKNNKVIKESIADNWGGLQFGKSIDKDDFLGDVERSSSFELNSRAEKLDSQNTEQIEVLESDSPLFMQERANSFDVSPDHYKEDGQNDHFEDLEPVVRKRKPKLAYSP